MDSNRQKDREANPVENAGLLSKLIFLFTIPLFCKKDIQEADIYKTIKSYSTTKLGNTLEQEWDNEKKRKRPWLLNSLLKVFRKRIIMWGLVFLVVDSIAVTAKPLLIGKIVKFFNPKQKYITFEGAILYAVALCTCLITTNVLKQVCVFQTEKLTQEIKISCTALVYRKLLRTNVNQSVRGQAINLITKDVNSTDMMLMCINFLVIGSFQTIIMTYIIYTQIGISAFVAMSWLLIYFLLQGIVAKCTKCIRLRSAAVTDQRIRETQQLFTAIRVIKMYTWETFHSKAVEYIRRNEMKYIRLFRCVEAFSFMLGWFSIKIIFCIAIVSYIHFGNSLTAETAFTVQTCLIMLTGIIQMVIPLTFTQYGNLHATTQRFTNFLMREEVMTASTVTKHGALETSPHIFVKNLNVRLCNTVTIDNISFQIEKGLTILKGPTGSGKSCILLSLLGEVTNTGEKIEVNGSLSYASQEPWIFPGTLKQNIVFGERYESNRYNTIVEACSLTKDFESFENGDRTYVTDRGLNLSRGQKTRINLARCVYKNADIYLLDDCLSALDTHVASHVFYNCIRGFLKNKICVMATHIDNYLKDANLIYELKKGSLVVYSNNPDLSTNSYISEPMPKKNNVIRKEEEYLNSITDSTETTKLLAGTDDSIYKEVNKQGSVSSKVYYFYYSSGGGIWIFILLLLFFAVSQGLSSSADYFVSIWVNSEQKLTNLRIDHLTNTTEYITLKESCQKMLYLYLGIVVISLTVGLASFVAYLFYSCATSINIHRKMLSKIVKAAMKFFDTNLSGNVLNRFTRDIGIIDESLPMISFQFIKVLFMVVVTLGTISVVNVYFVIPSFLLLIILYTARFFYVPTGRSIRRLEGSTRSPIIGHLNATVDGLVTIRANQMQHVLVKEFEQHQDVYNSVLYMGISTSSAFGLALDMLCAFYICAILFSIIFLKNHLLAGQAGLAITQSMTLSGMLLQIGIKFWAELENLMTAVERAMVYTEIQSEQSKDHKPANWPNNGIIKFNNVNLQYPLTGDLVLKQINFDINSKEKLGVVGRTGAGKSSLISVLFRLYEFDGEVYLDGVKTKDVNLQYLRSRISIIPQDPFLFTGTVRDNLDPQNIFSDKQLWEALSEVEMKSHVASLSTLITEGGNNFSIGQKQLICLARAILQKNCILVLDEATANLDPCADITIQKTIKNHFSDYTVITIAHRMPTIIDSDKILVMDQGQIVEFGSPKSLLNNKNGSFYKMIKEAGLDV